MLPTNCGIVLLLIQDPFVSFPTHILQGLLEMPLCLSRNKHEPTSRMWQIFTVSYFPITSLHNNSNYVMALIFIGSNCKMCKKEYNKLTLIIQISQLSEFATCVLSVPFVVTA